MKIVTFKSIASFKTKIVEAFENMVIFVSLFCVHSKRVTVPLKKGGDPLI